MRECNEPMENLDFPTSTDFVSAVESRRSVRVFSNDAIPESVVERCLDLALLAPNSSNLQPWEFYWVRSEELREKIIDACLSQPAAATAAELFVAVARTDRWKDRAKEMLGVLAGLESQANSRVPSKAMDYYRKVVPLAYGVGPFGIFGPLRKAVLNLIGIFRPIPREPATLSELKLWAVKSTALACENLMLAFRAFGYDTCPMEGMDSVRVKKTLSLGSGSEIVMVISAGKRSEKGIYGPRIRFSRDQFVKIV